MNLITVIAINKPFRRQGTSQGWNDSSFTNITLTREDILSGDWEVPAEMIKVDLQDVRSSLAASFTTAQIYEIVCRIKEVVK